MTFELIETRELSDIQSIGKLYRHVETGAEVFRIENDDTNKAFTIAFKTPPTSDNGIAHIIEHSVLNGSKRYPTKEPFVELLKGSMNTFVNAMTFSDKTIYPVASTNQKDFNNLMSVYLDAVFQPNLYEDSQILQQEGWHYHLESPEDELIYKGVVYNEMKPAEASPDDRMDLEITRALYPGTCYAYESGGCPDAIVNLTQEEFVAFHKNHYHPSQSQTILYGDLEDEMAFSLLEEYFSKAQEAREPLNMAVDVPFVTPTVVQAEYPLSAEDLSDGKDYLGKAWHATVAEDVLEIAGLVVVMDVLFGNAQAPIKKRLLDAGIASDVTGSHVQNGYFGFISIIAKNTKAERMAEFEQIIDDALQQIIDEGIDEKLIQASLNKIAFRLKEVTIAESDPRGVIYAINALETWLYNLSPYSAFEVSQTIEVLREKFSQGYFTTLIETYLIDNPHRVTVTLKAVPGLNEEKEAQTKQWLQNYKATLSKEEINQLVTTTQALLTRQNTPDTPENLSKIPTLSREDLTTEVESFPLDIMQQDNGTTVYFSDQFTAGIDYVQLLIDLNDVPTQSFLWLSLMQSLLGELSTTNYTSQALRTAIDFYTGGITGYISALDKPDRTLETSFVISGKALEEMSSELIDLMIEILCETQWDQIDEIRKRVQRQIIRFEQVIQYNAHYLVMNRSLSQQVLSAHLNEYISGIEYLKFLKDIVEKLQSNQAYEVVEQLKEVHQTMLEQVRINVFYIGQKRRLDEIVSEIQAKLAHLPVGEAKSPIKRELGHPQHEAFVISQEVNYVGLGMVADEPFELVGSLDVCGKAIDLDYLWNHIRVQGGAYSAISALRRNGSFMLCSYRDPNLAQTLEVYQGIGEYIENISISESELLKYIIGTMSRLNQPMSAIHKAMTAYRMHIAEVTDQDRVRFKQEVLDTTVEQMAQWADFYKKLLPTATRTVFANRAQIDAAKDLFDVVHPLF